MPRVDTDSFYRDGLKRYGPNAQGAQWRSSYSQKVRFAALRELLPSDLSGLTLVDVGCGLGDLYRWLEHRGAQPRRYIGIDVVEPMVEAARARTRQEILHLDALKDPLPGADYYVCSGAMNTLTREETRLFIARCYGAARAGFLFNLLKGQDIAGTFSYWMPEEIRDLASELGARCRVEEGYMSGDFTVALRRSDPGCEAALPIRAGTT